MHHPWLRRIVAAPLALWFALAAVDFGGLHDCRLHDAVRGHHGAGLPHHAGHHTTATQIPLEHIGLGASQHAPPDICTCPGECCGPAAAGRPAERIIIVPAPWSTAPLAPNLDDGTGPSVGAQVVLPPALGPPLHATTIPASRA